MGECALTLQGTLTTIMDTLRCADIPTALSIIPIPRGDQATVSQLKEDLEKENMNSELQDKVTKLEDNKNKLLRENRELKLAANEKEDELKKEVIFLKNELEEVN